ncbi:MAG: phosphoheptose isomerase, partial [Candidatus Poribacteria bacterium]|nr:phosphoheptose isomerase [Candidatus Poribacteria bacterium]
SENVLRGIRYANDIGCKTVGAVGFGGGKLAGMVDIAFVVDSHDYGVVEDVHLVLNHILRLCIHETLKAA